MKKVILFVSLLVGSSFANAWITDYVVPRHVHVYSSSGNLYFIHQSSECAGDNVFELEQNHPAYYVIYSMLMEAYMNNKPVRVRYERCRPSDNKRPRVEGLYFQ